MNYATLSHLQGSTLSLRVLVLQKLFDLQWSYGVTMWEIFSGGKVPYPGTTPLSVIQSIEEGHRMSKPCNAACNEEM